MPTFTFDNAIEFAEDCNSVAGDILGFISRQGGLLLPDNPEIKIRDYKRSFVKNSLEFYTQRTRFQIFVLNQFHSAHPDIGLEPMRNILRGLLEKYCHLIYLSASGSENLAKYIWKEMKYIGYISNPDLHIDFFNAHHAILGSIKRGLPPNSEIWEMISKHKTDIAVRKKIRDFETDNGLAFPSVKHIVDTYLDENEMPRITKESMYQRYGVLSEQIHGSIYFENFRVGTAEYQIIGFLILIYLKFLKASCKLIEADIPSVPALISRFSTNFSQDFLKAWEIRRQLTM